MGMGKYIILMSIVVSCAFNKNEKEQLFSKSKNIYVLDKKKVDILEGNLVFLMTELEDGSSQVTAQIVLENQDRVNIPEKFIDRDKHKTGQKVIAYREGNKIVNCNFLSEVKVSNRNDSKKKKLKFYIVVSKDFPSQLITESKLKKHLDYFEDAMFRTSSKQYLKDRYDIEVFDVGDDANFYSFLSYSNYINERRDNSEYDHVVYLSYAFRGGGWAGKADLGGKQVWMTIAPSDKNEFNQVLLHEIGHNLGFLHSSTETHEYGDKTSLMGGLFDSSCRESTKKMNFSAYHFFNEWGGVFRHKFKMYRDHRAKSFSEKLILGHFNKKKSLNDLKKEKWGAVKIYRNDHPEHGDIDITISLLDNCHQISNGKDGVFIHEKNVLLKELKEKETYNYKNLYEIKYVDKQSFRSRAIVEIKKIEQASPVSSVPLSCRSSIEICEAAKLDEDMPIYIFHGTLKQEYDKISPITECEEYLPACIH